MNLPITDSELETIILTLKSVHPSLYAKLREYKLNHIIKEKKNNGLS